MSSFCSVTSCYCMCKLVMLTVMETIHWESSRVRDQGVGVGA